MKYEILSTGRFKKDLKAIIKRVPEILSIKSKNNQYNEFISFLMRIIHSLKTCWLYALSSQASSMDASASFMYGFKLRAMIMLEVLTGKENIDREGD